MPKNGSLFFTIFQTFMSGPAEGRRAVAVLRRVSARLLRLHRHRRVPPRRRERREHLARHPRILRACGAVRPHRDAQAPGQRRHVRLLRRARLRLLAAGRASTTATSRRSRCRQVSTTLDEYVYTPDDKLVEGDVESGQPLHRGRFQHASSRSREREAHRVQAVHGADPTSMRRRSSSAPRRSTRSRCAISSIRRRPSTDPNYCQRVTANDGALGDQHLRDFQDNEKTIPTILTTSQKLSTGVDARNIRNIVLMRPDQLDDRVQADHRARHAAVRRARITSRSTIS